MAVDSSAVKQPRRYERLADAARDRYPQVTGAAVHSWVKRGILPAAEVRHTGFGVRLISEPDDSVQQLLALCRSRYEDPAVRDIGLVGLLLWIDGYDVRADAVRGALSRLAEMPRLMLRVARTPGSERRPASERIDEIATTVAYDPRLASGFDRPDVDPARLASGLSSFLGQLVGAGPVSPADHDGLAELGKVAGLDRARRHGRRGPTWARGRPADELMGASAMLSADQLVARVAVASEADLGRARWDARVIAAGLRSVRGSAEGSSAAESGLAGLMKVLGSTRMLDVQLALLSLASPATHEFAETLVAAAVTAGKMT